MRKLALVFVALSIVSCDKKSETVPAGSDSISSSENSVSPIRECYEFVQQKDTIALYLEQDGAKVTGNLRFKNYEKDSSKGGVKGEFSGDTLKLDYFFESEGMASVREIRFLKSGNSMIMGIGDMEDKNGKMSFSKPSEVKYEKSLVLVKTSCD